MTGPILEGQCDSSIALGQILDYSHAVHRLRSEPDRHDDDAHMDRFHTRLAWVVGTDRLLEETTRSVDVETLREDVIESVYHYHGTPERFEVDSETARGIAYLIGWDYPSKVITDELSMRGDIGDEDADMLHNTTNDLWKVDVAASGDDSVRRMLLNAFDIRSQEVFTNEDRLSNSVTVSQLEAIRSDTDPTPTSWSSEQDTAPTLDLEQVKQLRTLDPDGGLSYLYILCELARTRTPPGMDWAGMAHWAISKSPVLTRIVELVTEHHIENLRTVVVVDDPYCQQ